MKRLLFFETTSFTGATRVTRTIAKKVSKRYETSTVVINNVSDPKKEIQEAINTERPDILFCSFTTINPDVIMAGVEKRLIVVVRQDYKLSDLSDKAKGRIIETYPKASWVIVQTPEMKEEMYSYRALRECKIKVLENPLDEEYILNKAAESNPFLCNGNYHYVWVGRKEPIKDLTTLEKAFEIVHKQYPDTDLTLVFDEPNPYKWIINADCVVISSISEASPNVLMEALFLGTNVVSTDCSPTVRKLIPNDKISGIRNITELAEIMMKQYFESKEAQRAGTMIN